MIITIVPTIKRWIEDLTIFVFKNAKWQLDTSDKESYDNTWSQCNCKMIVKGLVKQCSGS